MPGIQPHRKKVKHFHERGDLHELTFSCYRRMKLLTNNPWRAKLSQSIDEACQAVGCFLAAFVYMPEHVHLPVWGIKAQEDVSELLSRIKQPVSVQVHADLAQQPGRLLPRLIVRDRPVALNLSTWLVHIENGFIPFDGWRCSSTTFGVRPVWNVSSGPWRDLTPDPFPLFLDRSRPAGERGGGGRRGRD